MIKVGLDEAEFGLFGALDPDALFGPAEDAPEEEVVEAVVLEPDESSDPEVDATLPDEEESLEPEEDESPPLPPPILEFAMDEFTEVSD